MEKEKTNRVYAYLSPLIVSSCLFFMFQGFWEQNWFMVILAFMIGGVFFGLYFQKRPVETKMMKIVNWIAAVLVCLFSILDSIGMSTSETTLVDLAFFGRVIIIGIYIIIFIINIVITKRRKKKEVQNDSPKEP